MDPTTQPDGKKKLDKKDYIYIGVGLLTVLVYYLTSKKSSSTTSTVQPAAPASSAGTTVVPNNYPYPGPNIDPNTGYPFPGATPGGTPTTTPVSTTGTTTGTTPTTTPVSTPGATLPPAPTGTSTPTPSGGVNPNDPSTWTTSEQQSFSQDQSILQQNIAARTTSPGETSFIGETLNPTTGGVYALTNTGGVYHTGAGGFYGSLMSIPSAKGVTPVSIQPWTNGYSITGSNGQTYNFG